MSKQAATVDDLVANCRRTNYSDESMLKLGRAVCDKPMIEMTNLEMSAYLFFKRVEQCHTQ